MAKLFLNALRADLFIAFVTFMFVAIITMTVTTKLAVRHLCTIVAIVRLACRAKVHFAVVAVVIETIITGAILLSILRTMCISTNPFISTTTTNWEVFIAFQAADCSSIFPHLIVSLKKLVEFRVSGWFLKPHERKLKMPQRTALSCNYGVQNWEHMITGDRWLWINFWILMCPNEAEINLLNN
mmetsp:Transcript_3635/g.5265  ORF Transcript_3635/g.5265 Transcript_3635/m.5265 type:complete len:184 (-) Transcript_3635:136-687(-)